jgi:hypothetical protein
MPVAQSTSIECVDCATGMFGLRGMTAAGADEAVIG